MSTINIKSILVKHSQTVGQKKKRNYKVLHYPHTPEDGSMCTTKHMERLNQDHHSITAASKA